MHMSALMPKSMLCQTYNVCYVLMDMNVTHTLYTVYSACTVYTCIYIHVRPIYMYMYIHVCTVYCRCSCIYMYLYISMWWLYVCHCQCLCCSCSTAGGV